MTEHAALLSDRTRAKLWFALLGGAVAWLAHLVLAWIIAEFGCVAGLGERHALRVSVVAWMIIAVSILTAALAVAATVVAWRLRRRFPQSETYTGVAHGDAPYMAHAGLLTSGLFVLVIVVETIPILFYLWRC